MNIYVYQTGNIGSGIGHLLIGGVLVQIITQLSSQRHITEKSQSLIFLKRHAELRFGAKQDYNVYLKHKKLKEKAEHKEETEF